MYIVGNDEEVLIFTDFHWGKSKNSETKIQQNELFIDWMISVAKKRNITHIIFMGDWFENRNTISVKTYNHSYDALIKISEADLNMHMIIGNHDIYYRETNDVNSLRPYNDIRGVTVYSEITEMIYPQLETKGLLVPWGTFDYEKLKDKQYDFMFGHFEFIGAVHNAVSSETSKHGFNGNEMTSIAPLVFSGHYHARREYNYKNGKVVCIGCPLQLDWGDYGDTKGVYIFNTKSKEYEFIENTVNAHHNKVYWSKIKQKDQSDLAKVKGNFVELVVDEEYKFESVMKVMNIINRLQPIKNCTVSYEYSKRFNFFDQVASVDDDTIIHKTKYDHLIDFVNHIDDEDIGTLKRDKVLDLCQNYYQEASLKVTDE